MRREGDTEQKLSASALVAAMLMGVTFLLAEPPWFPPSHCQRVKTNVRPADFSSGDASHRYAFEGVVGEFMSLLFVARWLLRAGIPRV